MKLLRHNNSGHLFQMTISFIYLLQVTLIPLLHSQTHGHDLENGHEMEICESHKDRGTSVVRCKEHCSDPEHHHDPSSHDSEDCLICKGISAGLPPYLPCLQKNNCSKLGFIEFNSHQYYPRHINNSNPSRAPPSSPYKAQIHLQIFGI